MSIFCSFISPVSIISSANDTAGNATPSIASGERVIHSRLAKVIIGLMHHNSSSNDSEGPLNGHNAISEVSDDVSIGIFLNVAKVTKVPVEGIFRGSSMVFMQRVVVVPSGVTAFRQVSPFMHMEPMVHFAISYSKACQVQLELCVRPSNLLFDVHSASDLVSSCCGIIVIHLHLTLSIQGIALLRLRFIIPKDIVALAKHASTEASILLGSQVSRIPAQFARHCQGDHCQESRHTHKPLHPHSVAKSWQMETSLLSH